MVKPTAIIPAHDRLSHLNMLLYGFPGCQKSGLAGSACDVEIKGSKAKVLVLECGQGETDTMVSRGYNPDVWAISEIDQLTEAYEYLRHEGCDTYDFLIWDSITGFEGRYMKSIMKAISTLKDNRHIDLPDVQEYLKVQNAIDRFASYFIDLPINFIATAHVMVGETQAWDEENNGFTIMEQMLPQIQGKKGAISQKVAANMNVIAYMETMDTGGTSILVRSTPSRLAKDRFGCLAQTRSGRMLNPTMPKIMGAIEAKKSGKVPAKAVGAKKVPAKGVAKKATVAKKAVKQVASPSKATRLRRG